MLKKCGICKSRKLIELHEKYFCESCNVYLNSMFEPCILPIPSNFNISDLCTSCTKLRTRVIDCKSFKDYMSKHAFCERCKTKLEGYLQYNFYKYFNIYKTRKFVFNFQRNILLAFCFILSFEFYYLKYAILLFDEIFYEISYFSSFKYLVQMFVGNTDFFNLILVAIILLRTKKAEEVYSVPVVFEDFNLSNHIKRLTISTTRKGFTLEKFTNIKKDYKKDLKHNKANTVENLGVKIEDLKI